MVRHYRFAGVELTVSMDEDRIYTDEYRLAPFAVDAVTEPEVFRFETLDELDETAGVLIAQDANFRIWQDGERRIRYVGPENDPYIRIASTGRNHQVQLQSKRYPGRIGTKTVLDAIAAEHLIARAGGFVFHCSYIERGGKAILFTAPSETGKSTQAELWKRHRGAEIINGDRAAVRIVDGQVLAEGIPFSGSSQYCENRSLQVEAIVYLGQAPVTTIRRMRGYEVFARIWEGVSVNVWDKTDMELVSAAVQTVVETVSVFHLPCTPDESAVTALEQSLESR